MSKAHIERPTVETIQAALSYLPSSNRDLWLKVGMALKAELADGGFDLFDTWSQTAENYAPDAVKSVWKGFKAGGKIGIGTLLYEAKQRGFDLKTFAPAPPVSAEDAERQRQERLEREAAEQKEIERLQMSAAMSAHKAWGDALDSGESVYLQSKKVQAHGVRFAPCKGGQTLLIPLISLSGKLWNLQRIFANGDKRFYKGGKTAGCFHVIGDALASECLLIAEGYATGATLYEATGFAVVIAFSASNLKHIAALMRERYPDKRIMMCADNDAETEKKTGKNAGVIAATEAAKSINALVCVPAGLPDGGNDFNDLMHFAGIEAVQKQVQAVIASNLNTRNAGIQEKASTVNQIAPQTDNASEATQSKGAPEKTPTKPQSNKPRKPAQDGQTSKPFYLNHENGEGVFYHGFHEGEPLPALKICSSLRVVAKTRDASNGEWGYLLEFSDPDGNLKRWAMPAKMLSGDGTQYRSDLLAMGLMVEPGLKQKNHLTTYIQTANTPDRVRCVDRIGWHENVYVLPDRTIGKGNETVLFQASGGVVSQFKQKGTLIDWQTNVAEHCMGNSRLLFFVSTAFASVLLPHAKIASGGFHIFGSSSTGKSTSVIAARSVFGAKDYMRSWRATDNSLEPTAMQYSDALLILDELGEADPKTVGNVIYMLGNETGKARATVNATAKKIANWRSMFISDGEHSLSTHMGEAGKQTKGGHEVRMAHINADAGKGFGSFETIHQFKSGAKFSEHIQEMSLLYYGTAGIAFIEWLVSLTDEGRKKIQEELKVVVDAILPKGAHGQVSRVAARFALVGLAGELATDAGITGWENGAAMNAATTCFNDWLSSRGGAGDIEHDRMLELLPNFIQVNGDSRFAWAHRAMDDHAPKTINQAGFKRMVSMNGTAIKSNADWVKEYGDKMHPDEAKGATLEYYLLPKVFKEEVCKNYDPRMVAAKLAELGVFETDKQGKTSVVERFAGTTSRYYKISSEKLGALQI